MVQWHFRYFFPSNRRFCLHIAHKITFKTSSSLDIQKLINLRIAYRQFIRFLNHSLRSTRSFIFISNKQLRDTNEIMSVEKSFTEFPMRCTLLNCELQYKFTSTLQLHDWSSLTNMGTFNSSFDGFRKLNSLIIKNSRIPRNY